MIRSFRSKALADLWAHGGSAKIDARLNRRLLLRLDRLDAATAGSHVIDGLWPGRTRVADLHFTLAPRHAQLRLSALSLAAEAKRSAKAVVKALAMRAW